MAAWQIALIVIAICAALPIIISILGVVGIGLAAIIKAIVELWKDNWIVALAVVIFIAVSIVLIIL